MEFDITDDAPYPRAVVFRTHRDELQGIAAHLPTVQSVELRSRTQHADGRVELSHDWKGAPELLPVFLRPFIPRQALQWTDTTLWDRFHWRCTWTMRLPALGPAVTVEGTNEFEERPDGTCRTRVTGSFAFHPERIPNIQLPPSAVPAVERFVVRLLVPVIEQTGNAARTYLDAQGAAA